MEIISVSIEKEKLAEIDRVLAASGAKSRSRLLSSALSSMLNEFKLLSKSKGRLTAVFTVAHKEDKKADVSRILHSFSHLIRTNVHHHTARGCLDVFIAEGEAEKVREMFREVKALKNAKSVSCTVI